MKKKSFQSQIWRHRSLPNDDPPNGNGTSHFLLSFIIEGAIEMVYTFYTLVFVTLIEASSEIFLGKPFQLWAMLKNVFICNLQKIVIS